MQSQSQLQNGPEHKKKNMSPNTDTPDDDSHDDADNDTAHP